MAIDTYVELKLLLGDYLGKMAVARGEMEKTSKAGAGHFASLGKASGLALAGIAVAAGGVAVASVKMAGDFQQNMSKLVTSGGETQKNLGADMRGVQKLMGETGTSAEKLAAGLYVINSAGFHGAAGLMVLKAAAEGAKTENADVAVVTDGLTTLLNDYRLSAGQAALVTSKMVEATAHGKTTFEALAGSLHTVSPIAHAAGLSMNEVLGAMATMTGEGTPAADAATYLRFAIGNLLNPTHKATLEMQALGISQVDLSQNLGKRGLTGTFQILTDAIANHMGPAGTVLIEKLQKSAKSTTEFQKVLANLPPVQQTYVGALANMVGGTKGMQAALELTGANAKVFGDNVKAVGRATVETGGHVAGWATVQQNFNQKLAEAKGNAEALGIKLGLVLIPWIEKMVGWVQAAVGWFDKHRTAAMLMGGIVVGAFVAIGVAAAAAFVAENLATLGIAAGIMALIAAAVLLGKNWKLVWDGAVHVVGLAASGVLTFIRILGDGFFGAIQGILGAASHLPFVGHYFAEANQHVKDAHATFDTTMTQWSTDAASAGTAVGKNFTGGVGKSLDTYMGPVLNRVPSNYMGPVLGRATIAGHQTGQVFTVGLGHGLDTYMGPVLNRVPDSYMGPVKGRTTTSGYQRGQDFTVGLGRGLDNFMGPVLNRVPDSYMGPVKGRTTASGYQHGQAYAGGLAQGLETYMGPALSRTPDVFMGPVKGRTAAAGFATGQDLSTGLGQGIDAATNRAVAAANLLVSKTIAQMHKSALTGSPSKLTMELGEQMALGIMAGIDNQRLAAMQKAGEFSRQIAGALGVPGGGSFPLGGAINGGPAANQALGAQMAAARGWTGAEWVALNNIVMGESGWSATAQNPTSSAYGIAQNIGGPAGYGAYGTSPAGQIGWMLAYIQSRYGDPLNAWNFHLAHGWYDQGGKLPPGLSLALNTTGRAEVVRPGPPTPDSGGGGPVTVVLQVDGKTLGNVVLTALLQEQQRRPLGIQATP